MPRLSTKGRHQKAVLWSITGRDRHGRPTFDPPVEVRVRWEWGREETRARDDTLVALDARVVVNEDVPIGSKMWLGELENWYGTGSAGTDTEIYEVVTSGFSPNVKGFDPRRVLGLKFAGDESPVS